MLIMSAMIFSMSASAQEYFGQNKVKYDELHFQVYNTPHFNIYYYDEEADAVKDVAVMSEIWYDRLSKVFHHSFTDPIRSFSMQVLNIFSRPISYPD